MSESTFSLPDLGEGLTEATLLRWLVAPGEQVSIDQPVAEVETAKSAVEVPCPFAGAVARLHGSEGDTVLVGAPLISVTTGEAESYREQERAGSGNVLVGYGTAAGYPARRRRVGAVPAPSAAAATERTPVAAPLLRKLARERGINLAHITGTGPQGRIVRTDLERATAAGTAGPELHRDTGLPVRERVPLSGMRSAVAATLSRSRREIPEATTWVDVDATALVELRESLRTPDEPGPGLLALVARFVLAGLAQYPVLNARMSGEAIEIFDGVHLGIATQAERGLVVPAVRHAHRLNARQLDTEIRRITNAARDGSLTAAELSSSSFTLNNYGAFGVDGSAAIINHPEVAILGMGRILRRPWIVGDRIEARRLTQLSLVFDHRVCDGATAAGFLRFVADAIEAPQHALANL